MDKAVSYSKYVSLGFNCEIAFCLTGAGFCESGIFNWALTPFSSLIDLIRNDFEGIYKIENLVPYTNSMVKDTKYNISFHTAMCSELSKNGLVFLHDAEERKKIYKEEYSKIGYFVDKWMNTVSSSQRIVYIVKNSAGVSLSKIIELDLLLQSKFPEHNYIIIVVYSKFDENIISLNNCCYDGNIVFYELSFFSPTSVAYASDLYGWLRLFAKYPLNDKSLGVNHFKKFYAEKLNEISKINIQNVSQKAEFLLGMASLHSVNGNCMEALNYAIEAYHIIDNKNTVFSLFTDIHAEFEARRDSLPDSFVVDFLKKYNDFICNII